MSDLTVAKTIAAQMGGTGRLKAFLGASNFVGDDNSLTFRFQMYPKATHCKITLGSNDFYTMQLIKVGGMNEGYDSTIAFECDGMYADMLVDVFEKETGLYLSF